MTRGMDQTYFALTKLVIERLVTGHFKALERDRQNGRHGIEDLKRELSEYPGSICMPPDAFLLQAELEEFNPDVDYDFWTEINLWFDNQESDLVLGLAFTESENPKLKVEISTLRVQ